jgi:hypothetical protein
MPDRILIRGEISVWVHVSRVLAGVAAVVGVVVAAGGESLGWWLAGGGAAASLWLEAVAWQARRLRAWLTLHPDGMEIESRAGDRAIHDSQVSAIALQTKKNLANGELTSVTRRFTIWAENWPEPIVMENRIKVGGFDPLAGLIQRLLERLRVRMEQDIGRGGTASGDNWHLSRSALTVGRPPHDEQLPLSDVAAVEPREGQMCIWRRGVAAAAARLPLAGRNVCLLPAVIGPFLDEGAKAPAVGLADSGSLGRVLFEKRASRSVLIVLSIVTIGLLAVGAMLLEMARENPADPEPLGPGCIFLAIGLLLGLLDVWLVFSAFRCHENGVWKTTLLGSRSLRFDELARFQYSAVKHYHHGAYLGTQITMRFAPQATGGRTLKFSTRTKGEDDDLERLRDAVSKLLAERMAQRFAAGEVVPWTKNIEFAPEGMRYRAIGFVVRKSPQTLRWENYVRWEMSSGVIRLFSRGVKKAVMTESAAAENFWPGFFFLQNLMHSGKTTEENLAATAG